MGTLAIVRDKKEEERVGHPPIATLRGIGIHFLLDISALGGGIMCSGYN